MRETKLLTVAVLAGTLALGGCATKKYVQEQVGTSEGRTTTKVAEVQDQVEENQAQISDLRDADEAIRGDIEQLSETAQDALQRAQEAERLSKGKILYEVTLNDESTQFDFDEAGLSDAAQAALDQFANRVRSENRDVYIEIQGHTDSIGSERYNLQLGQKRAEEVMRYMNMEHGIPLHRMNVISYGEYKPVADNETREGRAQNRRVTLVVLE